MLSRFEGCITKYIKNMVKTRICLRLRSSGSMGKFVQGERSSHENRPPMHIMIGQVSIPARVENEAAVRLCELRSHWNRRIHPHLISKQPIRPA